MYQEKLHGFHIFLCQNKLTLICYSKFEQNLVGRTIKDQQFEKKPYWSNMDPVTDEANKQKKSNLGWKFRHGETMDAL